MRKWPWRLISGGSLAVLPSGLPGVDMNAVQQALPIIGIHLAGITALVCMYLYFRRFDVDGPDDGEDWGGGHERGPGPSDNPAIDVPEPPLGEIRAYRSPDRDRIAGPMSQLRG